MKIIARRVLETLIVSAVLTLLIVLLIKGLVIAIPLITKLPNWLITAIIGVGTFLLMYSQICDWDKRAKEKSEFELCQMRAEFLQHKVNKYEEAIMSLEDEKIKEYLINKIKEND